MVNVDCALPYGPIDGKLFLSFPDDVPLALTVFNKHAYYYSNGSQPQKSEKFHYVLGAFDKSKSFDHNIHFIGQ